MLEVAVEGYTYMVQSVDSLDAQSLQDLEIKSQPPNNMGSGRKCGRDAHHPYLTNAILKLYLVRLILSFNVSTTSTC